MIYRAELKSEDDAVLVRGFFEREAPQSILIFEEKFVEVVSEESINAAGFTEETGLRIVEIKGDSSTVHNEKPTFDDYRAAASSTLEESARRHGYDNIVSACSYSTSTIPKFSQEGRAFTKWRDSLWLKCFEISGTAEVTGNWPSIEDAVAQLPVFEDVLASINE